MAFPNNPKVVNSGGDQLPELLMGMYEANTETFKKGALVYSGAGTGTVSVVASAGTVILGIAEKDATNVSSGNIEIPITLIKPEYLVKMRMRRTATDTLNSDATADIGQAYGVILASGVHYVDLDNVTNHAFVLVKKITNADGSATYWGLFRIISTASQYATGN